MYYVLFIIFTCGVGCSGHPPAAVHHPPDVIAFASLKECMAFGRIALSPAANPTKSIRSFQCLALPK